MVPADEAQIAELIEKLKDFLSDDREQTEWGSVSNQAHDLFDDILALKNSTYDSELELISVVWDRRKIRMIVEEVPRNPDSDCSDADFAQHCCDVNNFVTDLSREIVAISEKLARRTSNRQQEIKRSAAVTEAVEAFRTFVNDPNTGGPDVDQELERIMTDSVMRDNAGRFREIVTSKFAPLCGELFYKSFNDIAAAKTIDELSVQKNFIVELCEHYADAMTASLRDALYERARVLSPGSAADQRAVRITFLIPPKRRSVI